MPILYIDIDTNIYDDMVEIHTQYFVVRYGSYVAPKLWEYFVYEHLRVPHDRSVCIDANSAYASNKENATINACATIAFIKNQNPLTAVNS